MEELDYHEVMAEYTLLRLEVVCLKSQLDLARNEIYMLRSNFIIDVPREKKKTSQEAKSKLAFYHDNKDSIQKELGLAHPLAWQSIKKMTDDLYNAALKEKTSIVDTADYESVAGAPQQDSGSNGR